MFVLLGTACGGDGSVSPSRPVTESTLNTTKSDVTYQIVELDTCYTLFIFPDTGYGRTEQYSVTYTC